MRKLVHVHSPHAKSPSVGELQGTLCLLITLLGTYQFLMERGYNRGVSVWGGGLLVLVQLPAVSYGPWPLFSWLQRGAAALSLLVFIQLCLETENSGDRAGRAQGRGGSLLLPLSVIRKEKTLSNDHPENFLRLQPCRCPELRIQIRIGRQKGRGRGARFGLEQVGDIGSGHHWE